jgi:RNA polymerase sigma factor (sigma-70 family)
MADKSNFSNLTDQELLVKIKQDADYLGIVYKRCKSNCLGFMRKMITGKISDYELEDVFQDANIILYEKIVKGDFVLSASFQTYLNSVCRFQLLNTLGKSKLTAEYKDNLDNDDDENQNGYYSSIADSLDTVDHSNEPQFLAIETALVKMKAAGGHCYELLTLFWYHKKSMNELTTEFGYTNSDSTKNQKARCQKRLEKIAYNELNQ